ncbi:cell division protease FtsH [Caloranaerobacter azorensis DSM 13643]|uniref:ATP-dependent zinc metalloprotease FtsH n=1 Tax=Caloranaerobacter azorensis DSM 13643 TaxID=1121264 RepID=A0A1M5SPT7_9FIRM|nr:ATP-dependent zinc metalloprotease FtsH [Caloranaerobacter azorensis]SHH40549.1 cell division protease FtsH [Caloranaerobacter azorensis DSM 13643]
MLKKRKMILFVLLVFVLMISISIYFQIDNKDYKSVSYKKFIDYVEKGNVETVYLSNSSKIKGKLIDGTYFITDNPRSESFKESLLTKGINVEEIEQNTAIMNLLTLLLVLVSFGLIGYFLSKNTDKQAQREMAYMSSIESDFSNIRTITFDDVAGNEEAKESLRELVDFIKNPEKYEKYGARMPRGVLLYGLPGTGKTLLAKALAGEANVPYFAVTGSDFIQVYAGLGASRIRSLFKKARQAGKCVIFIDEIDALGKKRSGNVSGGNDESDRTLNALLTEMSGFKGNEGIVVIAATNRIDILDEALLRPGRFDRQIEVGLPDVNARYKILRLHSRNKPLDKNVDLKKVAYQTVYFSGAKLENLMNESAMIAAKNNQKTIKMEHIDKAFYTVIAGEEKKDKSTISLKDKRVTAYHEVGHALVTKLIAPENRVTKVTIIPSTRGAGGFSMNIPPNSMYQSKEDIIKNIKISLGGRAAEEIIFGKNKVTTGASNDLQKATKMALLLISRFGMEESAGLVSYETLLGNKLGSNDFIIKKTRDLLEKLYRETLELLKNNTELLEKISKHLICNETINEEELNLLISPETLS